MAANVGDRKLVSGEVFEELLTGVLSGQYAPGEKLPTQRALASDLGVTMSSLREALKRLEQMGLIEARQGDAMRVRDWREHGGLDVIAHLVFKAGALDLTLLENVFEARKLMLCELVVLASERRSDQLVARIDELARSINDAQSDESAQLLDFAFFAEIAQAAENIVFVLIMNSIRELYLQQAGLFPLLENLGEVKPLYLEIATAITDQDGERAARATAALADTQWASVSRSLAVGGSS